MTPVLLAALFVVGALLFVRVGERLLSSVLAVVVGLLVALLGALALGLGRPDDGGLRLADLGRAQGALVVAAFLIATAAFHMGRMLLPSLDRPGRKPVKVQRTASPTQVQRRTSLTQTQVTHDLRFQEYEVLDRIGVGGMGSVYRARRRQDGRTVALKVPQDKYLADAKFVKRFYREAEVLKRFNHPNIVRVYDYRMQDPEHYIAMEFLDGESLEDLLENRTLTFTESTQIKIGRAHV